jgi:hypothetical protein
MTHEIRAVLREDDRFVVDFEVRLLDVLSEIQGERQDFGRPEDRRQMFGIRHDEPFEAPVPAQRLDRLGRGLLDVDAGADDLEQRAPLFDVEMGERESLGQVDHALGRDRADMGCAFRIERQELHDMPPGGWRRAWFSLPRETTTTVLRGLTHQQRAAYTRTRFCRRVHGRRATDEHRNRAGAAGHRGGVTADRADRRCREYAHASMSIRRLPFTPLILLRSPGAGHIIAKSGLVLLQSQAEQPGADRKRDSSSPP